ncbi:hypothetical protein [Arthrobacter burdickii]|uniref:Bacterial spore germination immunoglobulin-like domain-containing protein n=1 Tax=Arthrobacter burdickii TaxID=3035920 RepID=A0ABT8K307_9MICC|nr:hypothetical protein [Arthrobacter burdickii]MDN4611795.1 hypothetical protein [Arthrobacter burdickii]
MPKLPSLLALAAITALLAGCASTPDDEPAAAPTAAAKTASASPSAPKPSATPVATSAAAPPSTPAVESAAPEAPATVPAAPAVAPPTAAPVETPAVPVVPKAPTAATTMEADPMPVVPVGVIVTPEPEYGMVNASVTQGASFTINGGGYQPGQQIIINFGIAQSDGMVMDEQSAIADAAGNYSFTITVGTDLAPGTYAVLTYSGAAPGGPEREASKRFAIIEVTAP